MDEIKELDLAGLEHIVASGGAAIRRVQRLQPAGGVGDKVFPSTYEGGQYALEDRVVDGRRVPCALLDSVQSQANRMELALKSAFYRGKSAEADIPVLTVDFATAGLSEIGDITSLDAPHRMADAILRDSLLDGQPFRVTPVGKSLDTASAANATDLYGFCPTALIFGLWDSTGPRGGSGTTFQRALFSEIVGVDVAQGVRPSSRLDPLGIELNAGKIFQSPDGWTLSESKANRKKDRPVLFGKEGKPSEINHGNVTPSLKNEKGQFHHGGITMLHAQQSVVLSLPALRRLSFPDGSGEISAQRDLSARTALAALALAGAHLSISSGCDLRSRCLLLPDPEAPADWELVGMNGRATRVHIADPCALVVQAAAAAQGHGLPAWRRMPIVLNPKPDLVELVKRSRALKSAEPAQG